MPQFQNYILGDTIPNGECGVYMCAYRSNTYVFL